MRKNEKLVRIRRRKQDKNLRKKMDTDKYEILKPVLMLQKKGKFASSKREKFSNAKSGGVEKMTKMACNRGRCDTA